MILLFIGFFALNTLSLFSSEDASASEEELSDGEWFPEEIQFHQFVADPRAYNYSAGYRWHDDVVSRKSVSATFGEEFPLYVWKNQEVFSKISDVQLSFTGAAWLVFDFAAPDEFAQFVNGDYAFGFQLTTHQDKWRYRLRTYHCSGHLGDEFLVARYPNQVRLNPSYEALDFFASYDLSENLKFYGGLGYIYHSDKTYTLHPLYGEFGAELRLFRRELKNQDLYMQPYLGMHFKLWEDVGFDPDSTYAIGCEWVRNDQKHQAKKFMLYLEYHDGYSLEGQFSRNKSTYGSINFGFTR